ncbi:MAG: hypothetical protein E6030_11565 [Staphylococcus epidermidis]|nr:hypothetical protein [Staphylococcus epidermidis]
MNMWYSKARENLLTKSVESQNFKQALSEFKYIGVEDNQTTDKNCELCDHPNIRYEYLVENQINQNTLIVGSRCIEKFIDNLAEDSLYLHDDSGNYVDKKRVSKDKKNYIINKALEYLREKLGETTSGDFNDNVLSLIKENKSLTINQLKYLHDTLIEIYTDDPKAKGILKGAIKVSLRKKHHKEQWNNLENNKRDFIKEFLTTSENGIWGF